MPKDQDQEERRKKRTRRLIGAGLLAGGIGGRLGGLAVGLPAALRQVRAGQDAVAAIKAAPKVDALAHFKEFVKKKGVSGEHIIRIDPKKLPWFLRRKYEGGINFGMAPGGRFIGVEQAPKAVIEHEAGHFIRGHPALKNIFGRVLGRSGIGYRRFILKPELQAWREAAPGAERRVLRRAALAAYKAGHRPAIVRGLTLPAKPAMLAGLVLLGLRGKKKDKKEGDKK